MLLSFVTSNTFIITMTIVLFFIMFGGITLYRNYKEEKLNNEVCDEFKEDESN